MKSIPILTALVAMFLVSCKNSTSGLPIPKDAAFVVHINGSSLSSKLSWEEIKATEWFKKAHEDEGDSLQKKLMENPQNSGVDIQSSFAFFVKKQGTGGYIVFEGKLKDAVAFESTIKKLHHNPEIKKDGDMSYVKEEGTSLLSWTSSQFIFMSDMPLASNTNAYQDYDKNRFHQDSLLAFTKSLLNLSGSNNIESDDRYTSLIRETGDVHFWMNVEQYMTAISSMANNRALFMMQGLNGLYEGSVATGTLSFDAGKIGIKTKRYLSEKMQQAVDKVQSKNITADEVNRIPSKEVLAAMVINYPPEISKELLKALGYDAIVNGFLTQYHTNLDEIVQATKGNLIFAVSDFSYSKPSMTLSDTSEESSFSFPKVNVLLGVSINNKPTFDKLMSLAQQNLKDSLMFSKFTFKSTNDWFAISNSPEAVNQFLAGGNTQQTFAGKITGHPFGAYIDLQKIIKAAQTTFLGNYMDTSSASMWQDVVMTGGDYSKGAVSGDIAINLVDKNTNALKQINQAIDKAYQSQKKRQQEYMRTYQNTDTTTVTPVPAPGTH